jgi:hypothetical protein
MARTGAAGVTLTAPRRLAAPTADRRRRAQGASRGRPRAPALPRRPAPLPQTAAAASTECAALQRPPPQPSLSGSLLGAASAVESCSHFR